MSANVPSTLVDENSAREVELEIAAGHVVCVSFPGTKESLPRFIELVDPANSDKTIIFRCEDGEYRKTKREGVPGLSELQQQYHQNNHCSCPNGNGDIPFAEVHTGDERKDRTLGKLQRKLRARRASSKEGEEHWNGFSQPYIQIPIQGLRHLCETSDGGEASDKDNGKATRFSCDAMFIVVKYLNFKTSDPLQ